MTKVLVISSVYPRFADDTEVPWMRELHRRLQVGALEVQVLCPSWKGLPNHDIDGIKIHRFRYAPASLEILTHDEGAPNKIAGKPWLQLLAIPYVISGFFSCLRLCHKNKFDLVHVHWPFPHGFIALAASWIFGIPVVYNFHGAELLLAHKRPWINSVLQWLLKNAKAVICNSSFTAGKVQKLTNKIVSIIPYGTTLGECDEAAEYTEGTLNILVVGRQIERKGLRYLLEAMSDLSPGEFSLVLVGEGDCSDSLRTQAKDMPHVHFTGKISAEQLRKTYRQSHVFVLPAIVDSRGDTEGLGVVLIEAIEYGLCVVASRVGGILDVIKHQETGLLVEPGQPALICEALRQLRTDTNLRKRLRLGARSHVKKNFSWNVVEEKLLFLYTQLSQGRTAGARK